MFRDYGTFVAPDHLHLAPYFGELGGGIEHELPLPIQKYIDSGQIELIGRKIPSG